MHLTIHTDGGARGNPGPAGFGVVITDESKNTIYQKGEYLGVKTNNEAEYAGLIHALDWLVNYKSEHNIDSIKIFMDSKLVIEQINGHYKVKAVHLKPLYLRCRDLIAQLSLPLTFSHTLRVGNSEADSLANLAMDNRYN